MSDDPMTTPDGALDHQSRAKPPHGADDGKGAGRRGGAQHGPNFDAASHGVNAQTGQPSAHEDERSAPGISTDKKADDTR